MLWHPGSPQDALTYEPVKKVFSCPEVGYFCEHESWSHDASVFSFNCGEFIGAIHDQADNNSFTFFARGVPIIIDAGAANKAEEGFGLILLWAQQPPPHRWEGPVSLRCGSWRVRENHQMSDRGLDDCAGRLNRII